MFIDHQQHRSPENNPELGFHSQEGTSIANDYIAQEQWFFHQPTKYSNRKQYHLNIKAPTYTSFYPYGSK